MKMRLMTVKQVATMLQVSQERVYEMVRLGLLPAVRLGRQLRVDEEALKNWIAHGGQALPGGWRAEEKTAQ